MSKFLCQVRGNMKNHSAGKGEGKWAVKDGRMRTCWAGECARLWGAIFLSRDRAMVAELHTL